MLLLLRFLAFGFVVLAGVVLAKGLFWLALLFASIAIVAAVIAARAQAPEDGDKIG